MGGGITLVLVGGMTIESCSITATCPELAIIPLTDDVTHAGGFPPPLECADIT